MIHKAKKKLEEMASSKVLIIAVQIVIVLSVAAAFLVYHGVDKHLRKSLLTNTKTIAATINPARVASLSGTSDDLTTENYKFLKDTMVRLHAVNPETRFVYLMGYRDGRMFFFVDSEPPESDDYSPPGDIYYDTTLFEVYNFINGISVTEGPYTDAWGNWISAYSSIFDDQGYPIAIIGMDVDVKTWKKEILNAELIPLSVFVIFSGFLISYYILRQKKN